VTDGVRIHPELGKNEADSLSPQGHRPLHLILFRRLLFGGGIRAIVVGRPLSTPHLDRCQRGRNAHSPVAWHRKLDPIDLPQSVGISPCLSLVCFRAWRSQREFKS
jgi:hypothetical protein